jgi:hypothetical protein
LVEEVFLFDLDMQFGHGGGEGGVPTSFDGDADEIVARVVSCGLTV